MKNFSRHIQEAIELNSERMPLYAELSKGGTIPFSKKLIRREKLVLHGARLMDKIGEKYQRKGVSFLEEEFVEMSLTPAFSKHYPTGIEYQELLREIDLKPFKKKARLQIRSGDYTGLMSNCKAILEELSGQAHVYCMVRHIIESIYQIASLIPKHEKDSLEIGIKPPTPFSRFLLRAHLFSLSESEQLDKDIAPIQNQNIPFLFQDLPSILPESR